MFVAKSTRRSEAALEWLGDVQDIAEKSGFRIPRLLRGSTGKLCYNNWTLEPFLKGIPATEDQVKTCFPMLEKFYALSRGHAQRPGFLTARELCVVDSSGDISLQKLPSALVAKLRFAWVDISKTGHSVIHADFGIGNLLFETGLPAALIDWDECRVDATFFDLPDQNNPEHTRAKTAWEIAACWEIEPKRACKLASLL